MMLRERQGSSKPNARSRYCSDPHRCFVAHGPIQSGISKVLEGWKPLFPSILEDILAAEVPPDEHLQCGCGRAAATTRCRDCMQGGFQCPDCLVESHRLLPFHWVEVSNGRCLEKRDLSELGLVLYLGHQGIPCPTLGAVDRSIMYTLTHTNGVHRVRIQECCCARAHRTVSQLLRAGLFPATLDRPESAFTFHLLRQWDLHFLTSKKSAYDFFEALHRLTDNTGTRPVKVSVSTATSESEAHRTCRTAIES